MIYPNVVGRDIRQRAFQTVTNLDEHFAVLNENEKDRAVAPIFLSDAPRLGDALGVIGNLGVALHFREHRDHDLV